MIGMKTSTYTARRIDIVICSVSVEKMDSCIHSKCDKQKRNTDKGPHGRQGCPDWHHLCLHEIFATHTVKIKKSPRIIIIKER